MAENKNAPEPKIVAATGSASRSGVTGSMIERVMAAAGLYAMEHGVTDPDEIRAIKLAARQKFKEGAGTPEKK